jgi:nucleoside-diphosphate-sugar epimerase
MPTIAIIGAGGYVGSRFVESCILGRLANIRCVIRSPRSLARLCRFAPDLDIRFADAKEHEDLFLALDGCNIVLNLVSGNSKDITDSTRAIHKACHTVGAKRLIHMSSAVVYGQVETPDVDDNSPPLRDHWMPYARAKAESELFLKDSLQTTEVQILVLRPGIVWGPRSPWSFNAAQDLINHKAFLVGDGQGICNTIYIDNLIAVINACLKYNSDASGFYNVADDEIVTWHDFYASLASYLHVDMSTVHRVSAHRFRQSIRSVLEDIQRSLIYNKIKNRVPKETKAAIKIFIKELSTKSGNGITEIGAPSIAHVSREMWYLQTVKHKLSNEKFKNTFKFKPPFSFEHGTKMTHNWLKFLNL